MSTASLVLVVEDNQANLMLATAILQTAGYGVEGVDSAEAARVWLSHSHADLVLMDVGLPGMDGLTYTRELKADPRTRDIPVVALSAHAMVGDATAALDAGCDDYLTKPLTVAGLLQRISALLPPRQPTRRLVPVPSPE
jgi:CheY-like chemotaxis protein